ncbi:retrovirus-related Pol polyprotein from transposon TNT 1-94 [Trifolium medium]|uniref:Retrovirus-related Pol polyprotein from transposon TNT 1-94 n=1 Tax=Trifolium medium TaxID=97028 RepID=A0A392MB21_9FABA|nr:retrovirus-related Pol polyprotein from transposon TNT 1-94 [Trifolium medium]
MRRYKGFDLLKQKMMSVPVLALPNFDQELIIESDASGLGIGAILVQQGRPVAYFGRALGEKNSQIHLREGINGGCISHSTLASLSSFRKKIQCARITKV